MSGGSTFGYAANRRRIRLVHEHTGELIHLSPDGHVDEAGAILAVLHDEAAEERLVDFRLELDVLGARHLLQLLRNHELLLVFELDRGSHRRDLRVRRLAEQSFKLGDDGLDLVFTSLVHQQVQEVARERVEASLLAELRQNILLLFRDDGRVGQEARNAGVRLDVRVERLHIGVHLFERAGGLARVDERRGVTAGHRVGLQRAKTINHPSVYRSRQTHVHPHRVKRRIRPRRARARQTPRGYAPRDRRRLVPSAVPPSTPARAPRRARATQQNSHARSRSSSSRSRLVRRRRRRG